MQSQLPGFVEIFVVRLKADAMAENRCNIVERYAVCCNKVAFDATSESKRK